MLYFQNTGFSPLFASSGHIIQATGMFVHGVLFEPLRACVIEKSCPRSQSENAFMVVLCFLRLSVHVPERPQKPQGVVPIWARE